MSDNGLFKVQNVADFTMYYELWVIKFKKKKIIHYYIFIL